MQRISREFSYRYFAPAPPGDLWSPKIRAWQARENAHLAAALGDNSPAPVSGPGREAAAPSSAELRQRYAEKRLASRARHRPGSERATARNIARWVQDQATEYYIPDGAVDHWATLEETLARGGDDCDGLELLTYHLLRDLGFGKERVFRAIVHRPSDGQHHMVTLWFEDLLDPWVLDPTGAMTEGMPRMSEVPSWVPLKVFGLKRDFTVVRASRDV
jgi:predicted transglutaminase-like cysteine proteinase